MYGYILRAQQPIDTYHVLHAEIADIVGSGDPVGLLVHFAYATARGYDMVEVWESKDQFDTFTRDVVSQAFERLGISLDGTRPEMVEFEPVEVITPPAHSPTSR
jgi:hypothetical protein